MNQIKVNSIYEGDCLKSLRTMPDKCVDMCVTSPPYYALRDYGCEEQIGLEETPEAYINRLADVFDEIKRVLKDDGTLWVNIGDSYNGYKGNKSLKPKDLIGIPWMLAFELRKRGWYLRQDIIWAKGSCMPESVKDRCTKSHEYIFLLSKSQKYYFDYEAIQEEANYDGSKGTMMRSSCPKADADIIPEMNIQSINEKEKWQKNTGIRFGGNKYGDNEDRHFQTYSGNVWTPKTKNCKDKGLTPNSFHINRELGNQDKEYYVRNKRSVWHVNSKPYKEAHFAVYPEMLIQPCILAGSKEGGIVLDPFMGSGTTAVVSKKLGRKYVGCELNPEYIKIAEKRLYNLGASLFDN